MAKKNARPTMSARKKVEEKKLVEKQAKRLAFWQQYKKQIIIGAAALVVAIVALVILIDFCYVPKGSVRTFMGKPQNVTENMILREMDGHYFQFATMEQPEGYEVADYGMQLSNDPAEQYRYFETADDTRAVKSVYVCGVEDRQGSEMLDSLSGMGLYKVFNGPTTAEIGGKTVHYAYTATALMDENGAETGEHFASLIAYIDTIRDSSVLVNCGTAQVAEELLPTEEAMVAELEGILNSLQLP